MSKPCGLNRAPRKRRANEFLLALLLAVISIEPATMLFLLFVGYALSGYLIYAWRKATGQHASIVSTSTEEPDEQGLHR